MKINGEVHYRWRTVDHDGELIDSFASKVRDEAVAERVYCLPDSTPLPASPNWV